MRLLVASDNFTCSLGRQERHDLQDLHDPEPRSNPRNSTYQQQQQKPQCLLQTAIVLIHHLITIICKITFQVPIFHPTPCFSFVSQ